MEKEVPNPCFQLDLTGQERLPLLLEEQGMHKALLAFRARFQGPAVLKQGAKGGDPREILGVPVFPVTGGSESSSPIPAWKTQICSGDGESEQAYG